MYFTYIFIKVDINYLVARMINSSLLVEVEQLTGLLAMGLI
jgi:hypothetical protein